MRRIKTTLNTFYSGAMAYRLGVIKIERRLGSRDGLELTDVNGYGPTLEWKTPEAWITTDWKGDILDLEYKDV